MKSHMLPTILAMGAAILTASTSWADLAGPGLSLRTLGSGGPALLDSNRGFSSGFNPITRKDANVGFNTDTDILYGMDNGGSGTEVARMDAAFEYEKGASFVNAGTGTTRVYTTGYQYAGSVAGSSDLGNSKVYMGATYDPFMTTNGFSGVMAMASSGGAPNWQEYIPQSASEALGQINEGTVASPQDQSARVTTVTLQDGISGYGAGHWHGLEMDAFKGQFTATDGTGGSQVGPRAVSRYFFGQGQTNFKPILIVHADAARSTEPAATAVGAREAYKRNRTTADATLLSLADFDDLVPGVDDLGYDMAQDPATGDLYILSAFDQTSAEVIHEAYLSAIRLTIPDDSTQPMSWERVDLDSSSAEEHLVLSTLHADLAFGGGLAFNAEGSRLYVSVPSTSGGAQQAVYALNVTPTAPVPEPATMALLAIGGLSIAGMGLLRHHRRAASAG